MLVVYSSNVGEVGMFSWIGPFRWETMLILLATSASIGSAWVEISNTGFLSFYIIQLICLESCILHKVVPCHKFLNDFVFFKFVGSLIQLKCTVPLA